MERCQPDGLAFMDVSKAFDYLSHDPIFLGASSAGVPVSRFEFTLKSSV